MNWFRRVLFNLWYFFSPPWDTGVSPPELIAFIESHPPGRALDLGCGTGTNVITLARHGWHVTGVDFAATAIAQAKSKTRQAGVAADLRVADVTNLKGLPDPFDLILDMGCFHSLSGDSVRQYVQNLDRLLASGGAYLLYGFFRDPHDGGPGLVEADIIAIKAHLALVERRDGTERGLRPSAWFTFRKAA